MEITKAVIFVFWFFELCVLLTDSCDVTNQVAVSVCRNSSASSTSIILLPDTTGLPETITCECTISTMRFQAFRIFISTTGWGNSDSFFYTDSGRRLQAGYRGTKTVVNNSGIFYQKSSDNHPDLCLNVAVLSPFIGLGEPLTIQCFDNVRTVFTPTLSSSTVKDTRKPTENAVSATTRKPGVTVVPAADNTTSSVATIQYLPENTEKDDTSNMLGSTNESHDKISHAGLIVGVIGAFLGGVLATLTICYILRRRQRNANNALPTDASGKSDLPESVPLQDKGYSDYIHPVNTTGNTLPVNNMYPTLEHVYEDVGPPTDTKQRFAYEEPCPHIDETTDTDTAQNKYTNLYHTVKTSGTGEYKSLKL